MKTAPKIDTRGDHFGAQIVQMANSIWVISAHKLSLNFVVEIEQLIFCQTLCAGVFFLGKQSLMKSTPEVQL